MLVADTIELLERFLEKSVVSRTWLRVNYLQESTFEKVVSQNEDLASSVRATECI